MLSLKWGREKCDGLSGFCVLLHYNKECFWNPYHICSLYASMLKLWFLLLLAYLSEMGDLEIENININKYLLYLD